MPQTHSRIVDGQRHVWHTEKLWALAADLPAKRVLVDSIAEFDEECWFHGVAPTCRQVAEHARRIQNADLSYPIILSANGKLMDGGHRIAKAWLAGTATIEAIQFASDPPPDEIRAPD